MRILVVSAFEASSLFAHAINTVKMSQEFARMGHTVRIICRRPEEGKVRQDVLRVTYGLTSAVLWTQLPNIIFRQKVGEYWLFACVALPAAIAFRPDLVFSRNYIFPCVSSSLGIKTIVESHAHPDNTSAPFSCLTKASGNNAFSTWVTISESLRNHYIKCGVPKQKIIILPDGVDFEHFRRPDILPVSPYTGKGPHIVYAGHLYDYKGIPDVIDAAGLLPEAHFHFVGGWPDDIHRHQEIVGRKRISNITFHGLQPLSSLPKYLWHADCLLLPPSAKHPSAQWTSPMKLGEYLASGTPVVATDIPALRCIVTDAEVEFTAPDDAQALAQSIRKVITDRSRAAELASAGVSKAESFSFKNRAMKILQHSNCSPRI